MGFEGWNLPSCPPLALKSSPALLPALCHRAELSSQIFCFSRVSSQQLKGWLLASAGTREAAGTGATGPLRFMPGHVPAHVGAARADLPRGDTLSDTHLCAPQGEEGRGMSTYVWQSSDASVGSRSQLPPPPGSGSPSARPLFAGAAAALSGCSPGPAAAGPRGGCSTPAAPRSPF